MMSNNGGTWKNWQKWWALGTWWTLTITRWTTVVVFDKVDKKNNH